MPAVIVKSKPVLHKVSRQVKVPIVVRKKQPTQPLPAKIVVPKTVPVISTKSENRQPKKVISKRLPTSKATKPRKPTVKYVSKELTDAQRKQIAKFRNIGVGKTLAIIGNGPSVLEADLGRLADQPLVHTLSINRPDPRIWPTTYWLFCDKSQYNRHRARWDEYSNPIFTTTGIEAIKTNCHKFKNLGGTGFSMDVANGIHVGRSSVYAAMQLANWLNYDKIYIFGIDMCAVVVNGERLLHYFGVNPDVEPTAREKRFDAEAKYYEYAAEHLAQEVRGKFVFCSTYNPYGFVNKFSRLDHRKAVDVILNG